MTRFCWWTLTWFGLGVVFRATMIHAFGGWEPFHTYYGETVIGLTAITELALWIGLWHWIVKHEPERGR